MCRIRRRRRHHRGEHDGPRSTLVKSRITHNRAQNNGGGIYNENSGTVALKGSTVTRNAPNNCAPAGSINGCTNTVKSQAPHGTPPAKSTRL